MLARAFLTSFRTLRIEAEYPVPADYSNTIGCCGAAAAEPPMVVIMFVNRPIHRVIR
jgi:hypothetical protein